MDLSKYNILVTGGAGFIGSNIVEYLVANGVGKVLVLDNLSTGHRSNLAEFNDYHGFEFIEDDIRNIETCQNACEGMDFVFHLAALGSVPRSIDDPIASNEVNVSGFLNMLVAIRDKGVRRMVYAASSSTYGDSVGLPKVEDKIGKPLSPYAVTKYVNELYSDVFATTYGIETIGLRYFNVFGPKQDTNGAYAAVIPKFINQVLKNEPPTINGDGNISRDFTYVDNAVQANIKAMLVTKREAINEVYNVACGEATSLNDLFRLIKDIARSNLQAIHGPERKGDIPFSLADINKATDLLDYQPEIKIKEGLEKTFDWFRSKLANG